MPGSDFVGSLAVVTGGGSGIGRAVCSAFAREGCKVIVADINQNSAEDTVRQLKGSGHCAIPVNVGIRQSVVSLFREIKARCNRSPDLVVNCAGIVNQIPLLDITEDDFDNIINVNLKGTFLMTQEGCRQMIEDKLSNGSIINIASVVASKGYPLLSSYSASKGGVESFTRAVALEMAHHGIRVNAVSPGPVDTALTKASFEKNPGVKEQIIQAIPLGRMAEPEEIAEVCLFLSSRKSSYITGSVVHANGGYGV